MIPCGTTARGGPAAGGGPGGGTEPGGPERAREFVERTSDGGQAGDGPTDAGDIRASLVDPSRFSTVFERHVHSVARFLARRVAPADVEDLVAETFVAAFRSRQSYDLARPNALPWLYGIATNVARRHARTEARRNRLTARWQRSEGDDAGATDGGMAGAEARLAALDVIERLVAALDLIEPTSRETLLLFAHDGLTYEEIGQALGLPVGAVRSRISRARARLRELTGSIEARHE